MRENVEDGVRELKNMIDEFNGISDKFAEPMSDDEMNALLERQGVLQGQIDAANGWDLDRTLEIEPLLTAAPIDDIDGLEGIDPL